VIFLLPALIACGDDPSASAVDPFALARQSDADVLAAESADQLPQAPPESSDLANLEGILFGPYYDADADRAVWVRRPARAQFAELVTAERVGSTWKLEVLVAGSVNPDRPAISEDGQTVAFVAGLTGIASVWTLPFDGSQDPLQHTNVDLHRVKRAPGQPPPGFVPPPVTGSLAFSDDLLLWEGPTGTHTVRWR
jgi:hypothetical protein